MVLLKLALKSLKNRSYSSILTVVAIALSVLLLLSVQRAKRAAEEGFTQTISQTHLIVGPRTGAVQLLLYTVFNIGTPANVISFQTYEELKKHPAVEWTIPYSLGDGHKGFRVVGTNLDFFKHYRFRGDSAITLSEGQVFHELRDVVLGAEVAEKLKYKIGDKVVVAHGVTRGEGVEKHDDKPFTIVGIMSPTGTALDQSLYVSLEGVESLHQPGEGHLDHEHIDSISAFFLRTKSRSEILSLQREINTYKSEALLGIIPAVTLSELWRGLSYVEGILKFISWMVVVVGFMAMLIALTSSLNERRREMAILRAIGAGSHKIAVLLILESAFLTIAGVAMGTLTAVLVAAIFKPWLESEFGLYLVGSVIDASGVAYLLAILVAGILIGLIPAYRAQRTTLKDGLSVTT